MIVVHIFSRIKNIFITILAILRRGLCCLSRKRKPSYSDCEVLTSVNVDTVQTDNYSSKQHDGVSLSLLSAFQCKKLKLKMFFISISGRT